MPFANIKVPQAALSKAQKEEIVHRVTNLFVEYFGEAARAHYGPDQGSSGWRLRPCGGSARDPRPVPGERLALATQRLGAARQIASPAAPTIR
jgi:Tautomerase enzyme